MDLIRHLRYFTVVAEELHFGHAAVRLGMKQPPLSQRIKRLEDELGVRLFDRSARQVRLTPAGRLLLAEARELVGRAERLRDLVRGGETETIRLGVPPDLAPPVLAALIAGQDARLAPSEAWTSTQVSSLFAGDLDAGLVRHPVTAPGLRFGPIVVQHPGVLLVEDDPLAARPGVQLADLAGRELLLFPESGEPGAHAETLAECRRHGFVPVRIHHGTGLGLVLAGSAVAFGPDPYVPGITWRPLLGSPLAWRFSVAWYRPAPEIEEFAAAAVRALKEHAGMTEEGAVPVRKIQRRPASGFLV